MNAISMEARPSAGLAIVLWMRPATTSRLRFREMTADDLEAMAAMLGDPDVMAYYPAPMTRQEAAAWIAWNERNYADLGYGLWILETHDGEFVGDCGLTWQRVGGAARLEVGYHVRRDRQGLGYATEAAAACRDFARDVLGASELVAIVHPENIASRRVAEKLGMRRAGDEPVRPGAVRTAMAMALYGLGR
jgi:RimJ/RimL family protein N-acetyltransferase